MLEGLLLKKNVINLDNDFKICKVENCEVVDRLYLSLAGLTLLKSREINVREFIMPNKKLNANAVTKLIFEVSKEVTFKPFYRNLTGSIPSAIFLTHLLYWFTEEKNIIYKTDEEIIEETSLTKEEIQIAKNVLSPQPFIKITKETSSPKTIYELNWKIFNEILLLFVGEE